MEPDEKIGIFRGLTLLPVGAQGAQESRRSHAVGACCRRTCTRAGWCRRSATSVLTAASRTGGRSSPPTSCARRRFDELGLRESGMVWEVVGKLAKKQKIRVTTPTLSSRSTPTICGRKIKEFSRESLADIECFATTLRSDRGAVRYATPRRRARAPGPPPTWRRSQQLPPLPNPGLTCAMAVLSSQVAKEVIPADIPRAAVGAVDRRRPKARSRPTRPRSPSCRWPSSLREDGYWRGCAPRATWSNAPR